MGLSPYQPPTPCPIPARSQGHCSWEHPHHRAPLVPEDLAGIPVSPFQVQCHDSRPLGMASDSFDDQYVGCTEEMEAAVAPRLLEEERARHPLLDGMWTNLSAVWAEKKKGLSLPMGFQDAHGIAILVYTDSSNDLYKKLHLTQQLYKEFNEAVGEAGKSRDTYLRTFPFKALHYYLSRALQLLREDCGRMYHNQLYRGVSSIRFKLHKAGPVRFGQFTSSSLDAAVSQGYGSTTFFMLRSCFGAHIEKLSFLGFEKEVLIPPSEVFAVSKVTRQGDSSVFVLRSTNRTCSHFNCAYLGGECLAGWDPCPGCLGEGGAGDTRDLGQPHMVGVRKPDHQAS
ncbi:ecto-ADP-ribosyltransferase 5-like [Alligator mississippiensis]|uniref:ecto-ADP-ribosyltransferase 5-like n=1 Tax=Alligator mississippiensis TaxID=8496 RepID=UPI002877B20D|nr:ecto-ADP-ribosyltransferase 5-like [Alligator mississippiensis]